MVLGLEVCATTFGTNAETSPPKRPTSRTSLEATKDHSGLVGMKIVSTPERWLFIWAICISASKSDTARSPRTIAEAPTSRATLTNSVDTDTMRTDGQVRHHLLQHALALGEVEEGRALLRVAQRGDDHLVEEPAGPFDDLEVPVVEGVEGSRKEADFHEPSPLR